MIKESLEYGSVVIEGRIEGGPRVVERRRGVSEYERAGQMLAHAVDYLVSEQLEGRSTSVLANRKAIALLCDAGRTLEQMERREPARSLIAGWLRKAGLSRAGDGRESR